MVFGCGTVRLKPRLASFTIAKKKATPKKMKMATIVKMEMATIVKITMMKTLTTANQQN